MIISKEESSKVLESFMVKTKKVSDKLNLIDLSKLSLQEQAEVLENITNDFMQSYKELTLNSAFIEASKEFDKRLEKYKNI